MSRDRRHYSILPLVWGLLLLLSLAITIVFHHSPAVAQFNRDRSPSVISLDGQWKFADRYVKPKGAELTTFDDRQWQSLTVPSNWFLQGKDFAGEGWYRRRFRIDSEFIVCVTVIPHVIYI
jgi:hypothetical protein